ncbi:carbonic anhydrase XVb [Lampris incognitus]|uniref:carbonic anhydrase XVb n=1 Tax=Lampris incognitus TaxID=2546036 RepID=UPI0024B5AA9E|nr:carbonic anhydrase XVb [Lampris incognitus]XP_056153397.1 carbonic anhydrase XVb [Lampris incognitus]
MNRPLFLALVACTFISRARCASDAVEWCYHLSDCNDPNWPTIAPKYCNGSRQSPINIVSASATGDSGLTAFTFHNYSSTVALTKITNTGKTVKVTLASGVQVSGGKLSEAYDSLQFHLHWGNTSSMPGSEHTVDGKRYPMELHIVNSKSSYNGNTSQAITDSTGLAALGFFIEEMSGNATASPSSWHTLTSYLANITEAGHSVKMTPGISLDDLLAGVDRTSYYRYLGSLTTPTCNEAVVWTVFKEPIKVSKDLIDLFSSTVRIGNSTSAHMINVYRNVQPSQAVTTQLKSTASKASYSISFLSILGAIYSRI